jgi:2-amino-4-hydroxy-6-hydroxymethyldihydropteridine diphosphokinase
MVQADPNNFHTVFIALGTNLGNRLQNLQNAISQMMPALQIEHLSPIYETVPWGYLEQPDYLNQVIKAKTYLSPVKLLRHLKHIEKQMGRQISVKNGPRLIDLDILFYDDIVLNSPVLTIPHPRMQGRAFMLVPLVDIEPGLIHPILKKTAIDLSYETDKTGIKIFAGGGIS